LEGFFYEGSKRGIQPKHAKKLEEILEHLHYAEEIKDMDYPGSNLHLLEPRIEGRWSVKVSGNWRVTFCFEDGEALQVDYEDYH